MARTVNGAWVLAAALWVPPALGGTATLPDPTRPPSAPESRPLMNAHAAPAAPAEYAVGAIVYGPSRRIATVNGQMVHEGSTVGGARVMRIERDAVFIDVAGQSRRLPVHADPVHKSASAHANLPTADANERNHD